MSEQEQQKYFEKGYNQCFREVIGELRAAGHIDAELIIRHLCRIFESSAKTLKEATQQ